MLESLFIALGLALGFLPILTGAYRARSGVAVSAVLLLWVAAPATVAWTVLRRPRPKVGENFVTDRPIEVEDDGYVSSRTCRSCHPHHYATWHASYHRTMTQVATPEAVLAPFDDVRLSFRQRTYHLQRTGDEFWVEMDDPDWSGSDVRAPRVKRPIVLTTGSHSLQVYWFATGHGRELGQLPFDYRIQEQQWIPDHASFLRPPWPQGVEFPVAGPGQWEVGCISCHATHGKPRGGFQPSSQADTRVAEFGIACEACHGPGAEHVRANRDPMRRYRLHLTGQADPTIVQPADLSSRLSSQVCGQCHSIFTLVNDEETVSWREHGYRYRPGGDLLKTRYIIRGKPGAAPPAVQRMHEVHPTHRIQDSFWSDGMVRLTGREYNGLIESPCYQRGDLSCFSCHRLHKRVEDPRSLKAWADDQLEEGMNGNQACLQCHDSYADRLQQHTHHLPTSTGSRCYNCHMSYTTYGLHKTIRSHTIDSPSVATSLQTGRPNACNQCHLDKTLVWVATYLERWYAIPTPDMEEEERTIAASLLWALRGDASQRALMAWSLGWEPAKKASGSEWIAPFLAQMLLDPYDAVRYIAYRSLRKLPGYQDVAYDFVATRAQRREAALQVARIWRRLDKGKMEGRRDGETILFDANGAVRLDVIRRLSREVDNRPIILRE